MLDVTHLAVIINLCMLRFFDMTSFQSNIQSIYLANKYLFTINKLARLMVLLNIISQSKNDQMPRNSKLSYSILEQKQSFFLVKKRTLKRKPQRYAHIYLTHILTVGNWRNYLHNVDNSSQRHRKHLLHSQHGLSTLKYIQILQQ